MVVMKRYLFILCFLSLNVCQAMLDDTRAARELKRDEVLCTIDVQELPSMIGKIVVYKVKKSEKTGQRVYDKGILGERLPNMPYYQVYSTEDKQAGTICCEKRIY